MRAGLTASLPRSLGACQERSIKNDEERTEAEEEEARSKTRRGEKQSSKPIVAELTDGSMASSRTNGFSSRSRMNELRCHSREPSLWSASEAGSKRGLSFSYGES